MKYCGCAMLILALNKSEHCLLFSPTAGRSCCLARLRNLLSWTGIRATCIYVLWVRPPRLSTSTHARLSSLIYPKISASQSEACGSLSYPRKSTDLSDPYGSDRIRTQVSRIGHGFQPCSTDKYVGSGILKSGFKTSM